MKIKTVYIKISNNATVITFEEYLFLIVHLNQLGIRIELISSNAL